MSEKYKYDNIIISGIPASGKSLLVRGLLERLVGWEFHSIGDLVKAQHRKVYSEVKTEIPLSIWWSGLSEEEQIKFNEDLFEKMERGKIIADTRYATICKDGNILYRKTGKEKYRDVRLNSLLVFVEAPLNIRAERVLSRPDYLGKSLDSVKEELERREEKEHKIGLEIFGVDYKNKKDYDIVINSFSMTPEEEISSVMDMMKVRNY